MTFDVRRPDPFHINTLSFRTYIVIIYNTKRAYVPRRLSIIVRAFNIRLVPRVYDNNNIIVILHVAVLIRWLCELPSYFIDPRPAVPRGKKIRLVRSRERESI